MWWPFRIKGVVIVAYYKSRLCSGQLGKLPGIPKSFLWHHICRFIDILQVQFMEIKTIVSGFEFPLTNIASSHLTYLSVCNIFQSLSMKILLYNEYNQVPTELSEDLLLLQANICHDANGDVSQPFSFGHHQIWSTLNPFFIDSDGIEVILVPCWRQ